MRKIGVKEQVTKGDRFGRWTVIKEVESLQTSSRKIRRILCKCDCGTEKIVRYDNLVNGISRSCGCYMREFNSKNRRKFPQDTVKSRIYTIWNGIKCRCYTKSSGEYSRYGAKGIMMCNEWRNDFMSFYNWAIANGYSDNLSIDRINNDKGYYPDNCRWATAKQQVNNTRVNHRITFNGETHTVSEWAQILNVTPMSIFRRLYTGWSEEEALTIPRFGKRTIQEEPMTTQDIMNVCKQSISCGLCKNKKEFCEMSGISKYVFFSIQKGQYKISDGIYLKVKAMQDKILKIKERK